MKIKKNQHMTMCVAVLSLSVLFAGCTSDSGATTKMATDPVVSVMKLGSVQTSGSMLSGKVVPNQEVQVVSKVAARASSVAVEEGAVVKAGDVLVQLESDDFIQQVNQAKAGIASARAKLADTKAGARTEEIQRLKSNVESQKAAYDTAQKAFERTQSLFASGAVSQTDLEKAQLALEQSKSGFEQAQAQLQLSQNGPTTNTVQALQAEVDRLNSTLQLARNSLDNTVIKSPISGIVARRSIDAGELAQPGVPLFTVVDMKTVQVQLSASQEQVNRIEQAATVDIKLASMPEKTFKGTVIFVSPISDANSSTFPVKVRVDNPEGLLRAGMIVDAYLGGEGAVPSMELPKTALVKKDDKTFVFQVKEGVAHLQEVSVAEKNSDWVFVNSGLKANDEIIINPGEQVTDGSKVTVK